MRFGPIGFLAYSVNSVQSMRASGHAWEVFAVATRAHRPASVCGTGEWRLAGSCRQVDPDLFFSESERGPTRMALIAAAKAVCEGCPVIQSCREHGLRAQEPYGIWGGLTGAERAIELRRERWNAPRDDLVEIIADAVERDAS